jgi:predicted tellurium resistance membrane protein TerC
MFEWVSEPEAWVALATLTVLEIVLGIDNIIFISIVSGKLPADQQPRARRLGLAESGVTRDHAVGGLAWVVKLGSLAEEIACPANRSSPLLGGCSSSPGTYGNP